MFCQALCLENVSQRIYGTELQPRQLACPGQTSSTCSDVHDVTRLEQLPEQWVWRSQTLSASYPSATLSCQ